MCSNTTQLYASIYIIMYMFKNNLKCSLLFTIYLSLLLFTNLLENIQQHVVIYNYYNYGKRIHHLSCCFPLGFGDKKDNY